MENLRKTKNVNLNSDPIKLQKLLAIPQLDDFRVMKSQMVLIDRVRKTVEVNKHICFGFWILESSKAHMFDFLYNVIASRYERDARLLFTDTNSLCYQIFTADVYCDIVSYQDMLDTSDYPGDHHLHSPANAKVNGKMKNDCKGNRQWNSSDYIPRYTA